MALNDQAAPPAHLRLQIPAGELQRYFPFSPCLLAAALGDIEPSPMYTGKWGKRSSGFKAGHGDSSPETEAGTGELVLGSLGCEWIRSLYLTGRNRSLGREKARGLDPRERILSSTVLRGKRSLGDEYIPLPISQPGRLRPRQGKQLIHSPTGYKQWARNHPWVTTSQPSASNPK